MLLFVHAQGKLSLSMTSRSAKDELHFFLSITTRLVILPVPINFGEG